MQRWRCLAVWVFLGVWSAIHAEEPQLPPLEVQITSKISTIKELQDNYFLTLQRQVMTALASLNPLQLQMGEDGKPRDGATQYRLVMDHTGTVTIGNQITSERINLTGGTGGGGWTRYFYIGAQQTGTLSIKLLKWEPAEKKYTEVQKWSAPMPVPEQEIANKGRVEVGKFMGGFSNADDGKAPVTLQDAQKTACLSIQPGNIRDVLLGKWLTATATKATPKPLDPQQGGGMQIEGELSIKNLSPWAIKRVQVLVSSSGGVFFPGSGPPQMHGAAPWVEFPQPLLPGTDCKIAVTGRDRKNQKAGIQGIEFLPQLPKP